MTEKMIDNNGYKQPQNTKTSQKSRIYGYKPMMSVTNGTKTSLDDNLKRTCFKKLRLNITTLTQFIVCKRGQKPPPLGGDFQYPVRAECVV